MNSLRVQIDKLLDLDAQVDPWSLNKYGFTYGSYEFIVNMHVDLEGSNALSPLGPNLGAMYPKYPN